MKGGGRMMIESNVVIDIESGREEGVFDDPCWLQWVVCGGDGGGKGYKSDGGKSMEGSHQGEGTVEAHRASPLTEGKNWIER